MVMSTDNPQNIRFSWSFLNTVLSNILFPTRAIPSRGIARTFLQRKSDLLGCAVCMVGRTPCKMSSFHPKFSLLSLSDLSCK